jgi:hypothetical protein
MYHDFLFSTSKIGFYLMLNFPFQKSLQQSAKGLYTQLKTWSTVERIAYIAAKIISLALLREGCVQQHNKIVVMSIILIGIHTAGFVSTFYRGRQHQVCDQLQVLQQQVAQLQRSIAQFSGERRVIWHF